MASSSEDDLDALSLSDDSSDTDSVTVSSDSSDDAASSPPTPKASSSSDIVAPQHTSSLQARTSRVTTTGTTGTHCVRTALPVCGSEDGETSGLHA